MPLSLVAASTGGGREARWPALIAVDGTRVGVGEPALGVLSSSAVLAAAVGG